MDLIPSLHIVIFMVGTRTLTKVMEEVVRSYAIELFNLIIYLIYQFVNIILGK
jgi:hypothetical protein